jgi:putative spermidine/putrescine transport system permease protein
MRCATASSLHPCRRWAFSSSARLPPMGWRGRSHGSEGAALAILLAPLVVPIVVTGLGLYFFFSDIGLGQSFLSVGLGHMVLEMPVVVVPILATLQRLDWDLVKAASSLGARPAATFWYVTLPMVAPGVLTGAILGFSTSFDEIVVALFLAPAGEATLPKQLFTALRDALDPSIVAIAAMLMLISICFLMTVEFVISWRVRTESRQAQAQ